KSSLFGDVALIKLEEDVVKGNYCCHYLLNWFQVGHNIYLSAMGFGNRESVLLVFRHACLYGVSPITVNTVGYLTAGIGRSGLDYIVTLIEDGDLSTGQWFACIGIPYHYDSLNSTDWCSTVQLVNSAPVTGEEPDLLIIIETEGKVILS